MAAQFQVLGKNGRDNNNEEALNVLLIKSKLYAGCLFNKKPALAGTARFKVYFMRCTWTNDLLVLFFVPCPFLAEAVPFSEQFLVIADTFNCSSDNIPVAVQPVS